MTTYKNERFQMSLQGLGTDTWRLEGRVKLNKLCKLRNARTRIKSVLMDWNDGLDPPPNESRAFNAHLAKCLDVKSDAAPFTAAGDTHSWTIVERQAAPAAPPAAIAGAPIAGAGGQAAAAARPLPPAGAGARAAAPAWAYRPSPCPGGRGDCAGVACGPCFTAPVRRLPPMPSRPSRASRRRLVNNAVRVRPGSRAAAVAGPAAPATVAAPGPFGVFATPRPRSPASSPPGLTRWESRTADQYNPTAPRHWPKLHGRDEARRWGACPGGPVLAYLG